MVASVLVDAGFVVALLSRRDTHHRWAVACVNTYAPPWFTCEAALSEAFHLLGPRGVPALKELLQRGPLRVAFGLADEMESVLKLMVKYVNVPMSLADGCLVRMTETLPEPMLLTADTDFRIYRRHSRHVVPCEMPR